MPRRPTKQPKHASKALPSGSPASASASPAFARALYGEALPGVVFGLALKPLVGEKVQSDASDYARDVIARMAPRDAAEEMLVAQLLFAHARVMRLTQLANNQTTVEGLRVVHEYADRASNTYRRLMLALTEYRHPHRTGDTFAVVKQANIAGQQVIQNHEHTTTNATNEQGCKPVPAATADYRPPTPALPADAGRVDLPAFLRPGRDAVEAVHRSTDTRGQVPVSDERHEARGAVG